jgi:hypothetical protein
MNKVALLRADKFIPLKEILAFNKMRKMNPIIEDVFLLMQTSDTVEV